jgi:hypothetical protein
MNPTSNRVGAHGNAPGRLRRRIFTVLAYLGAAACLYIVVALRFASSDGSYGSPSPVDYVVTAAFIIAVPVGAAFGLKSDRLDDVALLGVGSFLFLSGAAAYIIGGLVVMPIGLAFLVGGVVRGVRLRLLPLVRSALSVTDN